MSAPFKNPEHPLHGAITEIVSGCSALHMDPDPLPESEWTGTYLSDRDGMVKHSLEHFHEAIELVQEGMKRVRDFRLAVWEITDKLRDKYGETEETEALGKLVSEFTV